MQLVYYRCWQNRVSSPLDHIQWPHMHVPSDQPTQRYLCVEVYKRTTLLTWSLLQCPGCLIRHTWVVCEMERKWPWSWSSWICSKQPMVFLCSSPKNFLLALAGLSGIRAGRGIETIGRLEAKRLWLGHLRAGELHRWHFCHPYIALDLAVQFKL